MGAGSWTAPPSQLRSSRPRPQTPRPRARSASPAPRWPTEPEKNAHEKLDLDSGFLPEPPWAPSPWLAWRSRCSCWSHLGFCRAQGALFPKARRLPPRASSPEGSAAKKARTEAVQAPRAPSETPCPSMMRPGLPPMEQAPPTPQRLRLLQMVQPQTAAPRATGAAIRAPLQGAPAPPVDPPPEAVQELETTATPEVRPTRLQPPHLPPLRVRRAHQTQAPPLPRLPSPCPSLSTAPPPQASAILPP